jgi:hypothetical protein
LSQKEEAEVEQLATEFAARAPERGFSPAEIQSFLLVNKQSPGMAVANVGQWVTDIMEERKKVKNELQITPKSPESAGASESAKPSALGAQLKFYHFFWNTGSHLRKLLIMWRHG